MDQGPRSLNKASKYLGITCLSILMISPMGYMKNVSAEVNLLLESYQIAA